MKNSTNSQLITELTTEQTATIQGGHHYAYSPCGYGYYHRVPARRVRRNASFQVAASRLDATLFQ
ncbi:hypothetical protein IQ249_05010 [Lusitaniella coriacea LEGE 07157]|uniref:Uncharacterized protein n=1 Tax=Lusitaniella coriacea LEGE 07157 TaxID=945747 RepID=A0A8J7AS33_9CYAN|nr:hypothetical protein [Lusitaniella coriacea]MBE9115256.1 hypothetical protein [Lusitaniella coriacea LEGE 07157]